MDNWDSIRDQVYSNLKLKSTEELQHIIKEHDREEWSDIAFEVAGQILVERNVSVPASITPQFEGASTNEYKMPDVWEQVNWNAVYENCQKASRTLGTASFIVAAILIVGAVMLAIYLSSQASPLPIGLWIFLLLFLGLGVWVAWAGSKTQKADILLLDTKVNLITEMMILSRQQTKTVQFIIRKAFVLTPRGISTEVETWSGRREFALPKTTCDKWREKQNVHLLCLSTGSLLGELKDFTHDRLRHR